MKSKVLIILLFAFFAQSCAIMKNETRSVLVPGFNVKLTSVESPANAKVQYGDIIEDKRTEGDSLFYTFEDDYIKISWYLSQVEEGKFFFTLYNKSKHSLKVIWDDATLVFPDNSISRLVHNGTKFDKRNESQVSTVVPRGAKIEDVLVPTENIVGDDQYGWLITPIFDNNMGFSQAVKLVGKELKVLLPIKIENVQNEYTYVFTIDNIHEKSEYYVEKVHDRAREVALGIAALVTIPLFGLIIYNIVSSHSR